MEFQRAIFKFSSLMALPEWLDSGSVVKGFAAPAEQDVLNCYSGPADVALPSPGLCMHCIHMVNIQIHWQTLRHIKQKK